jgi:2-iminobutanoate/2-iminopropanoate deaminase
MSKEVITTDQAPIPTAPYSQAIKFQNVVYTSGTVGFDPKTGALAQGGIKPQVKQTLDNLEAILNKANTSLKNALKVNVYLRNIKDFPAFNDVYGGYFDKEAPPARTTVEVGPFAVEELLVEIDVTAHIPE